MRILKSENKEKEDTILDWEVKGQCNKEKEQWLNGQCKEIEELEKTNIHLMQKEVKEIINIKSFGSSSIV